MLQKQCLRRFLVYLCAAAHRKEKIKKKKEKIKKQIKKVKKVFKSKKKEGLNKELKYLESLVKDLLEKGIIFEKKSNINDEILDEKIAIIQEKLDKYIDSTENVVKDAEDKTRQLQRLEKKIRNKASPKKKTAAEKELLNMQKRLEQLELIYSRLVDDKSIPAFKMFMVRQKIDQINEKIALLQRIT